MDAGLTEIAVAHKIGFRRWRDFARALREGRVPAPDHVLPDGPRWSETRLDAWLRGDLTGASLEREQQRLIERLAHGVKTKAPGPQRAPRR